MASDWIHFLLTISTALGTVAICLVRIGRVAGQSESELVGLDLHLGKMATEVEELRKFAANLSEQIGDHRLHVATSYVSNERFDAFEGKLSTWMNRVEQKLDRLVERRPEISSNS